jgi:hypothetical protein
MKYSADLTINVHEKCEKSTKIEISTISSQKYWNYFQKKEGHLYLKLFYWYVYSVSAVVGNAIQFWVKINLPETKQSCQGQLWYRNNI